MPPAFVLSDISCKADSCVILSGDLEALGLPEGDGFGIFLFTMEGQIIKALPGHGGPHVGKDLGADALTLQRP